MPEYFTYQTT